MSVLMFKFNWKLHKACIESIGGFWSYRNFDIINSYIHKYKVSSHLFVSSSISSISFL